jgi:tRNA1(Val) A37 N6-methylase TrmN6
VTRDSPEPPADPEVTHGTLLNGRIRYDQPARGHRSGIEPVFLAAAIPARPGETVLEAGTGAGAALLCLAARVPGIAGLGVELDAFVCGLAARNFAALDPDRLRAVAADITTLPLDGGAVDHAMANPPWHDAAGTPSPQQARERARRAAPDLLAGWVAALARAVRRRGTLTLIARTATATAFLDSLDRNDCGSPTLLPLWPAAGVAAKLVIMQAVRGSRGTLRILPGLVLHAADGQYTDAAAAILRDGAPLPLDAAPRARRPRARNVYRNP